MTPHWAGDDVAAEVLMVRTAFKGTIVIVEGDDDCLVYEKFIDSDSCRLYPVHGRPNALDVMVCLGNRKSKGILAIVDADFWHLHGTKPPCRSVLVTDLHDIEIMMFASRAFDAVMTEYGSPKKIEKFVGLLGTTDLRTAILTAILPVGLLRLVSEEGCLALKFKGLDFDKVIDKSTLQVSIDDLIRRVLMLTKNSTFTEKQILSKLKQVQSKALDSWQACSGHDIAIMVGIGLRKALGNQPKGIGNGDNIERLLRLSYDSSDFRTTGLFKRAKKWEKANPPFTIFAL